MIRHFWNCWLIYWMCVLLLPVHSIFPDVSGAFFLQLAFVALVSAGYFTTCPGLREISMPALRTADVFDTRAIVRLAIYLSALGFCFLLFDKIFIQHIDYTSGLAIAREQWRELGEERDGKASSIWSVLGYAVGSAYYVAAVLVIVQPHKFSNRERLRTIAITFVFALANSVITGGRSNFLLIGVVALSAFSARHNLHVRDIFTNRRHRRYLFAISCATLAYIVYVFYSRAQANDNLVYMYVENFLPYMGLDYDEWYRQNVSQGWIGASGNMTILVLGYMTHSFATTAAIIDAPLEDKTIIFNNLLGILYKFGLVDRPDGEWFLVGRFPSVPGALWHQLGLWWFILISYLLGVAGALSSVWARVKPHALLPIAAYVLMATTLTLTPFVFAPDFLSFPSVVVAFILLAAVSVLRRSLMKALRRNLLGEAS